MTKERWRQETNKVIAENMIESISSLLNAKVIRQTTLNNRGESACRIILEYEHESAN